MKVISVGIKYAIASLLSVGLLMIFSQPVMAEDGDDQEACSTRFLTFPAWYNGLVDDNCEIVSPSSLDGEKIGSDGKKVSDNTGLSKFIWRVVLNGVEMILNLVGYASVAYIMYGGFKYMTSTGSSDGMASAKKTIMNAVIGLVISIAAVMIVRTVSGDLGV